MLEPKAKNSEKCAQREDRKVEHSNEVIQHEIRIFLRHSGLHTSEDSMRFFLSVAWLVAFLLDVFLMNPDQKKANINEAEKWINKCKNQEDIQHIINETPLFEIVTGIQVIEERDKCSVDECGE